MMKTMQFIGRSSGGEHMNKHPITSIILIIGINMINIANIIILINRLFFFSGYDLLSFMNMIGCFIIGWTLIPYFIIEILDNEFTVFTILSYAIILATIVVYSVLPIVARIKCSKNINGIIILLLSIDILISSLMLFSQTIIGIINIFIKAALIFLCVKNIRWYNENYELS